MILGRREPVTPRYPFWPLEEEPLFLYPWCRTGITSDEALNLSELPKKVIIIIAAILLWSSQHFSGLGEEAWSIAATPLRGFMTDIRTTVSSNWRQEGSSRFRTVNL